MITKNTQSIAKNMMTQYLFDSSALMATIGLTSSPLSTFSSPLMLSLTRSLVLNTVISTRTIIATATTAIAPE